MTAARSSHVRWFLIFWLFVLSAVSFLDRANISIASNSIVDTYGFTNRQLGYVFSALLAGCALFQTVGGRLADPVGSPRSLPAGRLCVGVLSSLLATPRGDSRAVVGPNSKRFARDCRRQSRPNIRNQQP